MTKPTVPTALLGCDVESVQRAAAGFLDDVRAMIAHGEMNANNLFNMALIDIQAERHGIPLDRARTVVPAYAWFALGALCVSASGTLPG